MRIPALGLILLCGFFAAYASGELSLVDPQATPETKALFRNLKRIPDDKLLFGHQHSTCYGVGWENEDNRSDVKDVTGSFPAVYGWDMGYLGSDHDRRLIVDAFERGGINTICWHMKNPVNGKSCKNISGNPVTAVLPGGSHHATLKRTLDGFADFVDSLRDSRGRLVPVVFRPWHEHTGGWFWWGSKSSTPEQFIELWRFTITYLRDVKGVRNLLYAYSPGHAALTNENDYETTRFPGYEYIDVLGVDCYTKGDVQHLANLCGVVSRLAEKHGKVAALTEFGITKGYLNCDRNDWYTAVLLKTIKETPDAGGIAWALTWRNRSKDHFWVPYPGHPAEGDFRKFYADPMTVFENDLLDMYGIH